MDELLKSRGVTRACSKCGTILASKIKGFGILSWHTFCKNQDCKSDEIIQVGMKTLITISSAVAAVFIFLFLSGQIYAGNITCKSFKTPDRTSKEASEAAQKLYDSDPVKWAKLDGWDHDGKVCE